MAEATETTGTATAGTARATSTASTRGPGRAAPASEAKPAERRRFPVRLHPDTAQQLEYWSKKREESANEYAAAAIEQRIARENGDYDLPTLEIMRVNQLQDMVTSMLESLNNLERLIVSNFESFRSLATGDSYLMDAEDGELGTSSGAEAGSDGVERIG